MTADVRAPLRKLRYALPGLVERHLAGPGAFATARHCASLERKGLLATVGHFPAATDTPATVLAANTAMVECLRPHVAGAYLSVKAPQLGFEPTLLATLAEAAASAGMTVTFDAHSPQQAEATHDLFVQILARIPGTGCVLPARWRRSRGDAERFRDTSARLRIVKGEWADPDGDAAIEGCFLATIASLAGREAPVAVATHRPDLARAALTLLREAGTPCELEQLRGLPMRRTTTVARELGVPVRVYVPFGRGWWPYALDKALARPHLAAWMARDWLGRPDSPRYSVA